MLDSLTDICICYRKKVTREKKESEKRKAKWSIFEDKINIKWLNREWETSCKF